MHIWCFEWTDYLCDVDSHDDA